jgi:hypothetical protein
MAKLLQRLFPSQEVKIILSAYKEERKKIGKIEIQLQSPHIGLQIVDQHIVNAILSSPTAAKKFIHEGEKPRVLALRILNNITSDHVSCGQYHIYRGILSMQGNGLRSLWQYTMDELEKLGALTPETKREATADIAQRIKEVG